MYIRLNEGKLTFIKDNWNDFGFKCLFSVFYEKDGESNRIGLYRLSYVKGDKGDELVGADEIDKLDEFKVENSLGAADNFDFYLNLRRYLNRHDYEYFLNKVNDIFYRKLPETNVNIPEYGYFLQNQNLKDISFINEFYRKKYNIIKDCYLRNDDLKSAFLCKRVVENNESFCDGDFIRVLNFDKGDKRCQELFEVIFLSDNFEDSYYDDLKRIMELKPVNSRLTENIFAEEKICLFFLNFLKKNIDYNNVEDFYNCIKESNVPYEKNLKKIITLIGDNEGIKKIADNSRKIEEKLRMTDDDLKNVQLCTYTKFENLMCILEGKSLLLSEMHQLNDPLEGKFIEKEVLGYVNDKYDINTFVTSLTDKIDALNMWNLYGDDGKGVCCIYNNEILKNNIRVMRVCYIDTNRYKIIGIIEKIISLLTTKWSVTDDIDIKKFILYTYNKVSSIELSLNDRIIVDSISGKESKRSLERKKQLKELYNDLSFIKNTWEEVGRCDDEVRITSAYERIGKCSELCKSIINFDPSDDVDYVSDCLSKIKCSLKEIEEGPHSIYTIIEKEVNKISEEMKENIDTQKISHCLAKNKINNQSSLLLEELGVYFKLDGYRGENEYRIIKRVDKPDEIDKDNYGRLKHSHCLDKDNTIFDRIILGPKSGEYDYLYPVITKMTNGYTDVKRSNLYYR